MAKNETEGRELYAESAAAMRVPALPERLASPPRGSTSSLRRANLVAVAAAFSVVGIVAGLAVTVGSPTQQGSVAPAAPGAEGSTAANDVGTEPQCPGGRSIDSLFEAWGAKDFASAPAAVPGALAGSEEQVVEMSRRETAVVYAILRSDSTVRAIVTAELVEGTGWYLAFAATCPGERLESSGQASK